jgi:drug/metabolite transporter (DMT)-like permease
MKTRYRSALTLAFLVFIYTLYTILLQIGGSTIGLIPQLFYAFLVGFVASCVLSFAKDRGKGLISIVSKPKMLSAILAAGIINNALRQFFLGLGTLGTNPPVASIIQRSWVIIVALFTPLVLRQKVNKMQMFAILVGFLGLFLIASGGTLLSIDYAQAPFMGFVLLSAVCSAITTLVMSKYTFDIYGATALFNLASCVLLGLMAVATNTSLIVNFPATALFTVLFFGIFGFSIATNLYYYSIKVVGPQVVGNALLTVPFVTILFSAIILNTPIKAYYLVAALLISAGVLLQHRYSSLPERITKKHALENMSIFDVTSAFVSSKNPEISGYMTGSNRAFAVKLDAAGFSEGTHKDTFSKYGCVSFTNKNPHTGTQREEIEFINDIMNLKDNEVALIGMGNPKKLEDAFADFVSRAKSAE